MIPAEIKIKNQSLPDSPGVYFFYNKVGFLLYVGKATSLKKRVGSYFTKAHDRRIAEMVEQIVRIDYIETPTVIEALVLEANQIKARRPKYNILERDDKSFLYLTITNENFPRPILYRGLELERFGVNPFSQELSPKAKKQFLAVFGPYTSSAALRKALDLVRKIIPWSDCQPPAITGKTKACFNVHIGRCPGVCSGAISKQDYRKIIKQLVLFFEGKKLRLVSQMKKDMTKSSKENKFEEAAKLRNKIFALEHIQDVAVISREDYDLPLTKIKTEGTDVMGRIEAYDISNISGTSSVGSMVVFEEGQPIKKLYRKFKIKTIKGTNDVAMLEEVLRRRLKHTEWPLPEVFIIDGGEGQINRVARVLYEAGVKTPLIGIAKGFNRKQDRLVFDNNNRELARLAVVGKEIFQQARDEAHRFAVKYHRLVRSRKFIGQ